MTSLRFIYWPLMAMVALAPLPFASVQMWAWGSIGLATGLMLIVWPFLIPAGDKHGSVPLGRIWHVGLLFLFAVVWALIQSASFTPEGWHHPIWADAARLLDVDIAGSVAVDPHEASTAVLRLLTYGGVFWLAFQLCRDRDHAKWALYVLATAAFLYAVYGLAVVFTGSDTVLWIEKTAYHGNVTSTFINRNSYATYAGIGLICVTAILTNNITKLHSSRKSWREQLRTYIREITERYWTLIVAWVVIATAIILTHSRAGFLSTCIGLLAFFVFIGLSPSIPKRLSRVVSAIVLAAGLAFFMFSGGEVSDRLSETGAERDRDRAELYALSLRALSDSPMLGMGYGSFPEIYSLYRTDHPALETRYVMAHNTYLENTMELGLPAGIALIAAVGGLAVICIVGVRRRKRDVIYPATGAAATALVAVHSLADFSLQIPAVAITFAFVMGLGCAQSWRTRD